MQGGRSLLITLSFALAALILPCRQKVYAQSESFSKAQVFSAYVFNFLKLTEFPGNSTPLLMLCLIKPDSDLFTSFKHLENESIKSQQIKVAELDRDDSTSSCSVLIFSANLDRNSISKLTENATSGLLTIGEDPNFLDAGGIIQLFYEGNKLRFEINLDLAEQNNIHFSSKLLGLAKIRSRNKENN